jgi:hypothetical protein
MLPRATPGSLEDTLVNLPAICFIGDGTSLPAELPDFAQLVSTFGWTVPLRSRFVTRPGQLTPEGLCVTFDPMGN